MVSALLLCGRKRGPLRNQIELLAGHDELRERSRAPAVRVVIAAHPGMLIVGRATRACVPRSLGPIGA